LNEGRNTNVIGNSSHCMRNGCALLYNRALFHYGVSKWNLLKWETVKLRANQGMKFTSWRFNQKKRRARARASISTDTDRKDLCASISKNMKFTKRRNYVRNKIRNPNRVIERY